MKKYVSQYLLLAALFTGALQAGPEQVAPLEPELSRLQGPERIEALSRLADFLMSRDPVKGQVLSSEALTLAREAEDFRAMVRALTLLGRSNDFLSQYEQAIRNYQEGIEIAESHSYQPELVLLYHRLGIVYAINGKREEGLDLCLKAVELAESIGDQEGRGQALGQAGVVYLLSKDYDKAQELMSEVLRISRQRNDRGEVAGALSNLGIVARKQGRFKEALDYQNEALAIYLELGETRAIASAYDRLGHIKSDLNETDAALDYHLKSLDLKERLEDRRGVAATLASIRDVYRSQGDLEKALEFFDRYLTASQEVFNSENQRRIDELQTRFEVETTERENSYLRRSKQLQLYAFIVFVLLLAVIATVTFLHYRLKSLANVQALDRQRLRRAIVGMTCLRDWPAVLRTLSHILRETLPCEHSGFLLLTGKNETVSLYQIGEVPREETVEAFPAIPDQENASWELFRVDERAELGKWTGIVPPDTKTLLSAPFRGGVVIISSLKKKAFRRAQCQVLADLALTLAGAHQRLEDLRALESREAMLRQAHRMEALGVLTTGIAHHFNNLMQVVLGNLALIRDMAMPEASPILADMQNAGDRISTMVNELMIFSKRSHRPKPQQIALAEVIGHVIERGNELISSRTTLTAQIRSRPIIWGNSQQLEQLLRNLIANAEEAVEALPQPQPGIRISLDTISNHSKNGTPANGNGRLAILEVSDNGIGMDSTTLSRAFDPFFTTRGPDRAGLGLSTVYSLVEQHGGRVELRSSPGQGSTVKLSFPVWDDGIELKHKSESEKLQ